jgi:polyhydroxyalkanoate synthesis repressor PhaR
MERHNRMASPQQPVIIKAYPNQRLYNPVTGSYVLLEDLAAMVEDDQDFVVRQAKTGEDMTRSILKQIILRRANHG